MTPAERAKRLEEIRGRSVRGNTRCQTCRELPIDCGCIAKDAEWLLSELAAAEQTIKRHERLIDGILVRCREAVDYWPALKTLVEAYHRGER